MNAIRELGNSIVVKGSYRQCMGGMYVDVAVTVDGHVVVSKNSFYVKAPSDPSATLNKHLTMMENQISALKLTA